MKKSKDLTKVKSPPNILDSIADEKIFLIVVLAGLVLSALFPGNNQVVMWIGFLFPAYAAVANDSIQSIGIFPESNKKRTIIQNTGRR